MRTDLLQVTFYLDSGIDLSTNVLAFYAEEAIEKAASHIASELGVEEYKLLDCKTVDVSTIDTHVEVWND